MSAREPVDRAAARPSTPFHRGARALHEALWDCNAKPDAALRDEALAFVERCRVEARERADETLPGPEALPEWMRTQLEATGARHRDYLVARRAGGPRRYFSSRSHALHFLREVAPTPLVDGAWLYGLLHDGGDPRLNDLLLTYLEELGDGRPDRNHVLIDRRLLDAIASFDLHAEFLRVPTHRAVEGRATHSDHARIEGRTVNAWLAEPGGMAAFVDALRRNGWLARGTEPAGSRFWGLLQGDAPSMFGVFNDYELQVIHDWIRGDAAVDGRAFERGVADPATTARTPVRAFRHARRRAPAPGGGDLSVLACGESARSDPDMVALRRALADGADPVARGALLRRLLGPAFHWSMAGLEATCHVSSLMRAVG